ncbi:hypothetical protein V6N13_069569 [Hibiscus sabdariffa]
MATGKISMTESPSVDEERPREYAENHWLVSVAAALWVLCYFEPFSLVGQWWKALAGIDALSYQFSRVNGAIHGEQETRQGRQVLPRKMGCPGSDQLFTGILTCRIVQIKLNLRLEQPGSSSVNSDIDIGLRCDGTSSPQETRSASSGGAMQCGPRLHAKRIVIAGSPVREEMENGTSENADQTIYINQLKQAPQLSSFKVPVESERLMDNELVLE